VLWAGVGALAQTSRATLRSLPDEAAQHKALALIRQLFREEYARPDPADRAALAQKLLEQAMETRDDQAARFALLLEARDLAARAARPLLAMAAIDEIGRNWTFDAVASKAAALTDAARAADATSAEAVARCALTVMDAAITCDHVEATAIAASAAELAAGKSRRLALVGLVRERVGESRRLGQERQKARDAMAILLRDPTDAAARAVAGRFLCFCQGQWDRGLALLAGGDDAQLKSLALRERNENADAWAQLQLAHDWWDLAQKQSSIARRNTLAHAASWYRRALPKLSGLHKTAAQKRIEEIELSQLKDQHLELGLAASLFAGKDFGRKVLERVDARIEFDWGEAAPADGMPKDYFSIRWEGHLKAPATGSYTLVIHANSGARLWVGNKLVLDAPNAWRKRSGERASVDLTEGLHPLRLEYWDTAGTAHVRLSWQRPGLTTDEPIPASCLFHDAK
jgi:hypothetical protein